MAYGQNRAFGLVPWTNMSSGIYNGQTAQFPIKSGYANNIFRGDLVYRDPDGYIRNLSEVAGFATATALGVFNGCSYVQPSAINPTDFASPGRPYWPGGTLTPNGIDATCDVIVDPNVIYTIQVDGTGIRWEAQGTNASVAYDATPNPVGNTNTGQSTMVLNGSTVGAGATKNLYIYGFDRNPGNPIPIPSPLGGIPVPYVNALVVISNQQFRTMPAGHA